MRPNRPNDVIPELLEELREHLDRVLDYTYLTEGEEFDQFKDALDKLHRQIFIGPDRPGFPAVYMRLAHELSKRSTCARLKVGTVITSTDFRKVLAVGYNGNAAGLPNCCDTQEVGNCGCIHSEENAIINCDTPRFVEKIVFVTHLPCKACAKRLINLGNVKLVYYDTPYRITDSLEILNKVGIEVKRLDRNGKLIRENQTDNPED